MARRPSTEYFCLFEDLIEHLYGKEIIYVEDAETDIPKELHLKDIFCINNDTYGMVICLSGKYALAGLIPNNLHVQMNVSSLTLYETLEALRTALVTLATPI